MRKPISDRLDAYFQHIEATSPPGLRAWIADSEPEFIEAVEDAVHVALTMIEAGARQFSALGERGLSLLLAQLLTAAFLPADAETYHNGHVDVTVRHPAALPFTMLGECKIYAGYERHCDGCEQLLLRYTSGRASRTFCLEFFCTPAMYEKLTKLRAELDTNRPLKQVDVAREHRIKGAFVTAHYHFTATIVEVLHVGCNVWHPEGGK